jgi:hypothetical protein
LVVLRELGSFSETQCLLTESSHHRCNVRVVSSVCNIVQRIPRNATATGVEQPSSDTADPDMPGSAVIRLGWVSDS